MEKNWIIKWRDDAVEECKLALKVKRISIGQYVAAILELLIICINGLHIFYKHIKEPSILDCFLN